MESSVFRRTCLSCGGLYLFRTFEKFKSFSLATTLGGVMVSVFASNRISSVMVNRLALSVVDRGFEPCLSQTKDYKIGICCISAKHAALKRKSKYWFALNQDNVSEWSDLSTHRLLFQ
jgi:hypothetical protein